MPLALSVIILLLGLACVLGWSVTRSQAAESRSNQVAVTRQSVRSLSKADLEKKLQALAKRKAPMPKMGAMCYSMAAPPNRVDYVCPTCGEKTLYTNEVAFAIHWEVAACRREFKNVKKASELALKLDESSFCSHCAPAAQKHELQLVVTYSDGTTHASTVNHFELQVLGAFLRGEDSFKTDNESEMPLKEHLPLLRKMLGFDPVAGEAGK